MGKIRVEQMAIDPQENMKRFTPLHFYWLFPSSS